MVDLLCYTSEIQVALTLVCAQFYLVSAAKTDEVNVCQLIESKDHLVLRNRKWLPAKNNPLELLDNERNTSRSNVRNQKHINHMPVDLRSASMSRLSCISSTQLLRGVLDHDIQNRKKTNRQSNFFLAKGALAKEWRIACVLQYSVRYGMT